MKILLLIMCIKHSNYIYADSTQVDGVPIPVIPHEDTLDMDDTDMSYVKNHTIPKVKQPAKNQKELVNNGVSTKTGDANHKLVDSNGKVVDNVGKKRPKNNKALKSQYLVQRDGGVTQATNVSSVDIEAIGKETKVVREVTAQIAALKNIFDKEMSNEVENTTKKKTNLENQREILGEESYLAQIKAQDDLAEVARSKYQHRINVMYKRYHDLVANGLRLQFNQVIGELAERKNIALVVDSSSVVFVKSDFTKEAIEELNKKLKMIDIGSKDSIDKEVALLSKNQK